jgi:hypothetical protein
VALGPSRSRRDAAIEAFTKPKRPDPDAPEVWERDDYVPTFFDDVRAIVDAMEAIGSCVAIATLPGSTRRSSRRRPRRSRSATCPPTRTT